MRALLTNRTQLRCTALLLTTARRQCSVQPLPRPLRASQQLAMSTGGDVKELVAAMQPVEVLSRFVELTQIPRPSKLEHKVLDWLKAFAKDHSLQWKQDAFGNMVICRPGSGGGEQAPTVVVQGHIDMVTEKNNDAQHDFATDPLKLTVDNGWLKAVGTTLGADNGVGVATALALLAMPNTAKLPPLECLFTVEEEIGLNGAAALDSSIVSGRSLVNLDSEDWGVVYIGCAGAGDCTLTFDAAMEAAPPNMASLKLHVRGLQGGHSGLQIHQGLGNAVLLLARTLRGLLVAVPGLRVANLTAGDKRNAIPREGSALLLVPEASVDAAQAALASLLHEAQAEYGGAEPHLNLSLEPSSSVGTSNGTSTSNGSSSSGGSSVMAAADVARLLDLLSLLPNGPVKFSHALPGLVETSNNLASIKPAPADASATTSSSQRYAIVTSTRSSLTHALDESRRRVATAARLCGAECVLGNAYAGWAPDPSSQMLQLATAAITEVLGHEPEVTAIHAGLECGILGQRLPGCDMVSYGPTILGAHSPDERLQLDTVQPFWQATLKLMERLADRR